jgi:hypothetical protein
MAPKPRLATLDDLPAIRALIPLSVRGLSRIRAFFVHPRAEGWAAACSRQIEQPMPGGLALQIVRMRLELPRGEAASG